MGSIVSTENTIVLTDIEAFWYVVFIAYADAYDFHDGIFDNGIFDKSIKALYYKDSTYGNLVKELLYEILIDEPSVQQFLLNQRGPLGKRLEADATDVSRVLYRIEDESCVKFIHHSVIEGIVLPADMKVFSICFDG